MLTLLTTLALLFLLLGTYLLSQPSHAWDGGLFVLLSLVVLGVLAAEQRRGWHNLAGWLRGLASERGALRREIWRRPSLLTVGALLTSFAVAGAARHRPADADFTGLFLLWLLALVTFATGQWLALRSCAPASRGPLTVMSRRAWRLLAPWEWGGLVLLVVVAGLLRGIDLGGIPGNLGGDEGTQLVAALNLVGGDRAGLRMQNPFATGWYSVPTMSFGVYGLAMRLFGATVAGGRALSALAGTLTVLTTFVLGRLLGGRRTGWIASVLITFSAYHIRYSRLASNQIFDPLIGTLVMGLVWWALQSPHTGTRPAQDHRLFVWGIAGIVAGLGWYAYFGARWVTFLVVLTVGVWYLADRTILRRHWRGFVRFGLGWLVAVLPLLGWYTVYPSALSERYKAVSVFASGWLAAEVAKTGLPAWRLMLQQVWRAATAFHLTPDPTFWYRPEQPLADSVTGALLLLGMVDAALRIHWPSRRLAHLWFWSTLAMAWVMTENPPSSQRGLLLMPMVAVFAAWGLERAVSLLRLGRPLSRTTSVALLLAVAVLNVGFYFGEYTPRKTYGNPTAERATALARYMLAHPAPVCPEERDLPCEGYVYVLGPPWFYWDFGSLAFMLHRFPGESVPPDSFVDHATGPARFVVIPERIGELERLRLVYPGGTETPLYGVNDFLLVVVYDWPGPTVP